MGLESITPRRREGAEIFLVCTEYNGAKARGLEKVTPLRRKGAEIFFSVY